LREPIISPNIRIRHPDDFQVGEGSIVDDFCYFSTRVKIGRFSHIANGCSVAGGKDRLFTFGDYGSLSSGVKIWCASDDFVNDMVTIIPPELDNPKENFIVGDVTFARLTAVGSNSVVMPGNDVPEGVAIGALSFVPPNYPFEAWTVYAGTPIRPVKARNREAVLRQLEKLERQL
jgi:acetyltransferase-like isoleucine patch superfamily enzyme